MSAVMRFGFRLRNHHRLLVLYLLLHRLLNNLHLLLVRLLLHLLLLLVLLDLLLLLLLGRALWLYGLLYHLPGGGDNLYWNGR